MQSVGPAAAQSAILGEWGFVNKGLVGVGRLPADMKDKFGETLGSGSGMAVDLKSWSKTADGYRGTFFVLPDRGYNVEGTTDYRARLNKVSVSFKPAEGVAAGGDAIALKVEDTILLTDAAGEPMSGLDPSEGGVRPAANGIPALPQTVKGRIALDPEAIVKEEDRQKGTFQGRSAYFHDPDRNVIEIMDLVRGPVPEGQ